MVERAVVDAYLRLVADGVLGQLVPTETRLLPVEVTGRAERLLAIAASRTGNVLARPMPEGVVDHDAGRHLIAPPGAFTMMGRARLDQLRWCIEEVIAGEVAGDLIEAGAWRGGATIFATAVLRVHGSDRGVYVADSFAGLPPPDVTRYPADAFSDLHTRDELAVSLDAVREHFRQFGVLDEHVHFIQGWFRDTLPALADHRWAVIRLDGDLYESTMDGLRHLHPGLSPGGFCIIDDYGAYEACRDAVHDYRRENDITDPIERIDWTGAWWRRPNG
jgi:O-methyltransferase